MNATPINLSNMDTSVFSMTSSSELPSLPPMSPVWSKYVNPDTMSCSHNLGFDMELADMEVIAPKSPSQEKTELILRLKIKPPPKLVLKLNTKKAYKSCSAFVTPLNKRFN